MHEFVAQIVDVWVTIRERGPVPHPRPANAMEARLLWLPGNKPIAAHHCLLLVQWGVVGQQWVHACSLAKLRWPCTAACHGQKSRLLTASQHPNVVHAAAQLTRSKGAAYMFNMTSCHDVQRLNWLPERVWQCPASRNSSRLANVAFTKKKKGQKSG